MDDGKKSFRPTAAQIRKMFFAAGLFVGVGAYMSATVFFLAYAGDWLDAKLGIAPLGRVAGIILGFPCAIWSLYDQYKSFDRR